MSEQLDLDRLDALQRIRNSRYHLPLDGPCQKALGERGCPCCDAHDDLCECVDDLIAECRELRWELKQLRDGFPKLTEKLEAENQRYRKALEDIRSRTKDAKAAAIAREALGG